MQVAYERMSFKNKVCVCVYVCVCVRAFACYCAYSVHDIDACVSNMAISS